MSDWKIIENAVIGEKVYYREVSPGLGLYVMPKAGYHRKYAVFSTRFGSIDNRFKVAGNEDFIEVPDGVAHFLEHKLFEDVEGDVFHRFAARGASPNAFTSFTQTAYLFSCTDQFNANLDLLLDFVQDPYFTAETVAKEQGIIGQEIRMYEDNPQWRLFFNSLAALYHQHPVRKDIAGTVESIKQITPDVLYRCYRTFYHPSNMALFVVGGGIDPDQVAEQVEKDIAAREYQPMGEIIRDYPEEPPAVYQQRVEEKMMVAQPLINIAFKGESPEHLKGNDRLRREIATDLLLDCIFSESEPLYNELYEEGLINEQFDAGYIQEHNYAHTMISGETVDPEQLYERILAGIRKMKQTGCSSEQVERHRRARLGDFMQRFNSLEFIANNFLAYRFKNIDFFAYPETLQDISVAEVNELLQEQLQEERHIVSLVKPSS